MVRVNKRFEIALSWAIVRHPSTMADVSDTDHRGEGVDGFWWQRDPGHPIVREDTGYCIQ